MPGFYYYDPTMLLLIPALLLTMWASFNVNHTFRKYSKVMCMRGLTGAEVARTILDRNGLQAVKIQRISGDLTDNFDPRTNVVNLSDSTYESSSIGAIGVAAHECGHAVQYANGYAPIRIRNSIVPIVNVCSRAAIPIIFIGFIIAAISEVSNDLSIMVINFGIILYSAVVLFQLVTLPVEFNASRRALQTVESYSILTDSETRGAKKVLNAAALTYVAAAFSAIMTLLRLILLSNNSRRRD